MAIKPRFRLSQTASQVTVRIEVPHVRVSAKTMEIIVEGKELHFYSSPYLLQLAFPGRLVDDAETGKEAKATFDPNDKNGVLTIAIWKEAAGDDNDEWRNLDLLGRLANPNADDRPPSGSNSKITVLSSNTEDDTDERNTIEDEDCGEGSAEIPPPPPLDEDPRSHLRPRYGFLNLHHSVFGDFARAGLAHDMLELPDPDTTPPDDRRPTRLRVETQKFDSHRYLADLHLSPHHADPCDGGDFILAEAFRLRPHWLTPASASLPEASVALDRLTDGMHAMTMTSHGTTDHRQSHHHHRHRDALTDDETFLLSTIQPKPPIPPLHTIPPHATRSTLLSLIDILYAYVYDHRTTAAEPTVESAWTVATLSPTLSWLESYLPPYDTPLDVFAWCVRRGLIYPYLRNYRFVAGVCVQDVVTILNAGRRCVIKCLLQVRRILDKSEGYYLMNRIYIDPFIAWVQIIEDLVLDEFAREVQDSCARLEDTGGDDDGGGGILLDKDFVRLGLTDIEKQAFSDSASDDSSSTSSDSSTSTDNSDNSDNSTSSSDDDQSSSSVDNDTTDNSLKSDAKKEQGMQDDGLSSTKRTIANMKIPGNDHPPSDKPLIISLD